MYYGVTQLAGSIDSKDEGQSWFLGHDINVLSQVELQMSNISY